MYGNCIIFVSQTVIRMKKIRIKGREPKTTLLLPRKNFLVGMGSVLNIRGQYFDYSTSKSGREADTRALKSDWEMIGKDICDAKNRFSKSI